MSDLSLTQQIEALEAQLVELRKRAQGARLAAAVRNTSTVLAVNNTTVTIGADSVLDPDLVTAVRAHLAGLLEARGSDASPSPQGAPDALSPSASPDSPPTVAAASTAPTGDAPTSEPAAPVAEVAATPTRAGPRSTGPARSRPAAQSSLLATKPASLPEPSDVW